MNVKWKQCKVFNKQPYIIVFGCEGVNNCSILARKSLNMSDMSWSICTVLAGNRNTLEYVISGVGDVYLYICSVLLLMSY